MKHKYCIIVTLILFTLFAVFSIWKLYIAIFNPGKTVLIPGYVQVTLNSKSDEISFSQLKTLLEQEQGAVVPGKDFQMGGNYQLPLMSEEETQKLVSRLETNEHIISVNINDRSGPYNPRSYVYLSFNLDKNISKNDAILLLKNYGIWTSRIFTPSYVMVSVPKGREKEYASRFAKYDFVSDATQGYYLLIRSRGTFLPDL